MGHAAAHDLAVCCRFVRPDIGIGEDFYIICRSVVYGYPVVDRVEEGRTVACIKVAQRFRI